jgi:hypothetical protein
MRRLSCTTFAGSDAKRGAFHVVAWATTALDAVRRGITAGLKAAGRK